MAHRVESFADIFMASHLLLTACPGCRCGEHTRASHDGHRRSASASRIRREDGGGGGQAAQAGPPNRLRLAEQFARRERKSASAVLEGSLEERRAAAPQPDTAGSSCRIRVMPLGHSLTALRALHEILDGSCPLLQLCKERNVVTPLV